MSTDSLPRLLEIMARLRGPGGCPWDQEQTHETIKPQLLEECYEVLEAIDARDMTGLREELGDVLLHVVFHAQLARERGDFDFEQVAAGIADKLVRRHPHVFGEQSLPDSAAVLKSWAAIKAREKPERRARFDGIPAALPALMRAQEVSKKAAATGFDWPNIGGPFDKVREEIAELEADCADRARAEDEFGDVLFSLVNVARHLKIDSEEALRRATKKFEARFNAMEAQVTESGRKLEELTLAEMDGVWDEVKARARANGGE